MLKVFTLVAALIGVCLIVASLGSTRSREEERSYRRNANNEDAWNWGEAPEVLITSTDDHYLHPEQPRTDLWPKTADNHVPKHTQ